MSEQIHDRSHARSFHVRARHESHVPHHPIVGTSFEDAAVAFIERWRPAIDGEGAVSVIVSDEHGCERCFTVDVEHGEAEPCA